MSDLTAAVEAAMHVMYGDHPHAENYRAHVQVGIAAAAPLIEAAARADERAKTAAEIRGRRCCGPDDLKCCCCDELGHAAAAIARQHTQETP